MFVAALLATVGCCARDEADVVGVVTAGVVTILLMVCDTSEAELVADMAAGDGDDCGGCSMLGAGKYGDGLDAWPAVEGMEE